MSFLVPKARKPDPLPATPTREDPAVEEARRKELIAASKRRGRGAHLVAGELEEAAPVGQKRLLGGDA